MSTRPRDERPAARVRAAAPQHSKAFSWLRPEEMVRGNTASVFVPVLLSAGVLLSAVAWVIERIARMTAGPTAESRLVQRLDTLALPPGGFLDEAVVDDPFAPRSGLR